MRNLILPNFVQEKNAYWKIYMNLAGLVWNIVGMVHITHCAELNYTCWYLGFEVASACNPSHILHAQMLSQIMRFVEDRCAFTVLRNWTWCSPENLIDKKGSRDQNLIDTWVGSCGIPNQLQYSSTDVAIFLHSEAVLMLSSKWKRKKNLYITRNL